MKFSVSKDKLLEGLSTVQNVVSTRTTLPILSNVLLQASDGEIRLTTTDLDVGIRGSVEAQVERTGATTLPARRLFSIVRELPSSEIYFDVDAKNSTSIRSKEARRVAELAFSSGQVESYAKRQIQSWINLGH
jgi:DNA polymerase-3 subunit beta